MALELLAAALLFIWVVRAARGGLTPLPGRWMQAGLLGVLALALLQALPIGESAVAWLSPASLEIRERSRPAAGALEAEVRLLGGDLPGADSGLTLSVEPGATASALRTGTALVALLLVAMTVAATCGVARLATALLVSGAFQGLYGLLVLASGHDRIWHVPKQYFLDAATGSFVNPNHFACFLAMASSSGAGLILHEAQRQGGRLASRLSSEGGRNLVLLLLLAVGLAGLLGSFSRSGILSGLLGLLLCLLGARGRKSIRARLAIALIVLAAAAMPVAQIGWDRLTARYAALSQDAVAAGGRATVWSDSLSLLATFPWTGTGFGTFAAAYPLVRSPEVRTFYAHAHNDLLQAWVEGGVVGAILLALVLVPVLAVVTRAALGERGILALGLAAGTTAAFLLGLVDFNFHIPANAATASILAGALLGLACHDRS